MIETIFAALAAAAVPLAYHVGYRRGFSATTQLLRDGHREELERYVRLVQNGQPYQQVAVPIDPPRDAEAALRFEIQEQTIQRGMEQLRAEYRSAGISVSDEEIREHVEALLKGEPILP